MPYFDKHTIEEERDIERSNRKRDGQKERQRMRGRERAGRQAVFLGV